MLVLYLVIYSNKILSISFSFYFPLFLTRIKHVRYYLLNNSIWFTQRPVMWLVKFFKCRIAHYFHSSGKHSTFVPASNNITMKCSICLELTKEEDIRCLPCNSVHTFCIDCLKLKVKSQIYTTTSLNFFCPVCKTKILWPEGGYNDLKPENLFKAMKREFYNKLITETKKNGKSSK